MNRRTKVKAQNKTNTTGKINLKAHKMKTQTNIQEISIGYLEKYFIT